MLFKEKIYLCQDGSGNNYFDVPAFSTRGWHSADRTLGTKVHLRTQSSPWSLAPVDINEIGSVVMLLPAFTQEQLNNKNVRMHSAPQAVHMEVKIAGPDENCIVLVLIWKAVDDQTSALSIENESSKVVCVRQANINLHGCGVEPETLVVKCKPNTWQPFGWVDPDMLSEAEVVVADSFTHADAHQTSARVAVVDLSKVGQTFRLPCGQFTYEEVTLAVEASENGRLLRIVNGSGGGDAASTTSTSIKPIQNEGGK